MSLLGGGYAVNITGDGFADATSVSFGNVPAASFTVNSDTSITAMVPSQPFGNVDVTVTTPYGTSSTSSADQFAYGKTMPTITWGTPADIAYGTPLDTTQLNASSGGLDGILTYSQAVGTLLNAGTSQTLSVTFTPGDTTDYTSVTQTVLINVNQATPVLIVNPISGVYTGSPFAGTYTIAGVTSGDSAPGLTLEGVEPTLTYYIGNNTSGTQLSGPPTAAGTYTVLATFQGSTDYAATTTQESFTIAAADTTTTLGASTTSTTLGQSVTLTARVAPWALGAGVTTGDVTFLDAGTPIQTATLNSTGSISISVSLALGTHAITVSYGGDANFNASSSAPKNVSVSAANISYTLPAGQTLIASTDGSSGYYGILWYNSGPSITLTQINDDPANFSVPA